MSEHTKEPWLWNQTDEGDSGLDVWLYSDEANCGVGWLYTQANAARIVACVNACVEYSNEELDLGVPKLLRSMQPHISVADYAKLEARCAELRGQNDSLNAQLQNAEERLRVFRLTERWRKA